LYISTGKTEYLKDRDSNKKKVSHNNIWGTKIVGDRSTAQVARPVEAHGIIVIVCKIAGRTEKNNSMDSLGKNQKVRNKTDKIGENRQLQHNK